MNGATVSIEAKKPNTAMSDVFLSIVIPVYNEASRIRKSLHDIIEFVKTQPYVVEVIVVDDGSKDDTLSIVNEGLKPLRHKILKNEKNRGKGYSVKRGILSAAGKYVLFTDADLSTPIAEVLGFIEDLKKGYRCVIGSRALPESKVEVRQSKIRENMGRIFNCFARLTAFSSIQDSQCGFKCFERTAAVKLFSLQKLDGFSFDAEILYLAERFQMSILEKPVTWRNSSQSRVNIFSDPLQMFFDLLRIRWLHRSTCF